jgi:hypothetical protein
MAAKPKAARKRVDLFAPGESERKATVWTLVEERPDGKALVTPAYQYDDLKPAPGWRVAFDGRELEIRSAEGAGFVCGG